MPTRTEPVPSIPTPLDHFGGIVACYFFFGSLGYALQEIAAVVRNLTS